ncbi:MULTISPECIES: lysophospholipid acyltransferase family protein [unclassified Corynebacterium]|uniref:lysophospholipid acyltransferase family protein n=1 Tax=unclassified Corynebacterium TaxID=2624378 RepID=UPI0029CA7937|nr:MULTISPECIES: lysophospholipid acyltransferase family protein [unclassified Corynebacterium]WPF65462.1 lysophospholipid acyltransferase family protein [Corynebacterium sp. 22KM0430]WPF67958.1 lysophospholipid acyltransferase family protein [Corynebacterium sp. 21KM1197]
MHNKWYWTFKYILVGPFLRVWNRPKIEGVENIPKKGSALLASSHQSVMDSFFFPLMCPRQITFPAKSEYFTTPGLVGRAQSWFFSTVGQVPVNRNEAGAAEAVQKAAQKVFDRGDLFGIYPEGTRSPDGRIYRGRTGVARIALATGEKIIPVGMIGTREANPIGSWLLRPRKVSMKVGKPIDPHAYVKSQGLDPDSQQAVRALTDHVMSTLVELTGYDYVDVYASEVKKSLEAGHGYPRGAEPRFS